MTTNYDNLIEKAANQFGTYYEIVSSDKEIPLIRGENFILKVHGGMDDASDICNEHPIVLKEDDYLNYSETFKMTETLVKSTIATNAVVFVGYSLSDYNVKLILNWVKEALKSDFQQPYFIYLGNVPISEIENEYQLNRGLQMIDWHVFLDSCSGEEIQVKDIDYETRYKIVFDKIIEGKKNDLFRMSQEELFQELYHRLAPLDDLFIVSRQSIKQALGEFVVLDGANQLSNANDKPPLLLFYKNCIEYGCPSNCLEEFQIITSVFNKASIRFIAYMYDNHKMQFTKIPSSGDTLVEIIPTICFDFREMSRQIALLGDSSLERYKKAFFYYQLGEETQAYEIYKGLAETCYANKDYILYYLVQKNRDFLFTRSRNYLWNDTVKLEEKERAILAYLHAQDDSFFSLPYTAQVKYKSIQGIFTTEYLYKLHYEAVADATKVMERIKKNSIEYGVTATHVLINQMNDFLYFSLGNYLLNFEWGEFRKAIRAYYRAYITKYISFQEIKIDQGFYHDKNEQQRRFRLDVLDLYCLIEFFNSDQLKELFDDLNVIQISFEDMEQIKELIENLVDFYHFVDGKNDALRTDLGSKIKTLLFLTYYFRLPESTYCLLLQFLFTHQFREIYTSDQILMIDRQVYKFKRASIKGQRLIAKKLIDILNIEIVAVNNGKEYQDIDTRSNLNYSCYANYLKVLDDEETREIVSSKIVELLSVFERNGKDYSIEKLTQFYHVVDSSTKIVINEYIEKSSASFSMFAFWHLINNDGKISGEMVSRMKSHIRNQILLFLSSPLSTTIQYPPPQPLRDLESVGCLCLMQKLEATEYTEFKGHSDFFDFVIEPDVFDYSKFDLQWIIPVENKSIEFYEALFRHRNACKKIVEVLLKESRKKYCVSDKQNIQKALEKFAAVIL